MSRQMHGCGIASHVPWKSQQQWPAGKSQKLPGGQGAPWNPPHGPGSVVVVVEHATAQWSGRQSVFGSVQSALVVQGFVVQKSLTVSQQVWQLGIVVVVVVMVVVVGRPSTAGVQRSEDPLKRRLKLPN